MNRKLIEEAVEIAKEYYYGNPRYNIPDDKIDKAHKALIDLATQFLSLSDSGLVLSTDEVKNIMPDLIEEHFPKGKCKERGQAIVLLTMFMLAIRTKQLALIAKNMPSVEDVEEKLWAYLKLTPTGEMMNGKVDCRELAQSIVKLWGGKEEREK